MRDKYRMDKKGKKNLKKTSFLDIEMGCIN